MFCIDRCSLKILLYICDIIEKCVKNCVEMEFKLSCLNKTYYIILTTRHNVQMISMKLKTHSQV